MEEREVYTGFRWGNLMDRDHSEDPGADGNTILKWIFKNWHGEAWSAIGLAHDRYSWRAVVSAVRNLRVP